MVTVPFVLLRCLILQKKEMALVVAVAFLGSLPPLKKQKKYPQFSLPPQATAPTTLGGPPTHAVPPPPSTPLGGWMKCVDG